MNLTYKEELEAEQESLNETLAKDEIAKVSDDLAVEMGLVAENIDLIDYLDNLNKEV